MQFVYLLLHKRKVEKDLDEWVYSTKAIGVYSSLAKAQKTISRYKNIEGFKDYPDDFIIEEYEVDFDNYVFE